MSIFLTLMGMATVLLAVRVVKRMLGTGGYLLPLALVVPLTYVTSHQLGVTSSIASLFQELPIRLFSGMVIMTIGLTDLVLLYRGGMRARRLLVIGFVCGAMMWNSQDFGLAATVVYGVMLIFCAAAAHRKRAIGAWSLGLILGLASYPIFLLSIRSPLNVSFVGAFIKLFGSGLGSAPMQVPGPVLVVMPIVVCSAAAGWALLMSRRRERKSTDPLLDQAAVTLTFTGTWSVLGLLYYVNRAYADGQLQTMLLPCAICIAALLSIAIHSDDVRAVWQEKFDFSWAQFSAKAKLFPVGVFVCLCFAAALLTPDPVLAAQNLINPPFTAGFANSDLPAIIQAIHAAQEYIGGKPGQLTYLGENFNYVSRDQRAEQHSSLSTPARRFGGSGSSDRLSVSPGSPFEVARPVVRLDLSVFGGSACSMYELITVSGLADGQLQELK